MKNIIFLFLFVMIPVMLCNAQDENAVVGRKNIVEKYSTKEVNCPECQGWGWLVSVTYKLGNADSRMNSSDATGRIRNNGNINTILQKVKCYYCGGTGKIWVKQK